MKTNKIPIRHVHTDVNDDHSKFHHHDHEIDPISEDEHEYKDLHHHHHHHNHVHDQHSLLYTDLDATHGLLCGYASEPFKCEDIEALDSFSRSTEHALSMPLPEIHSMSYEEKRRRLKNGNIMTAFF